MSKVKLTISCGDYEIVRPLKEGRVEIDGVDLTLLTSDAARDRTFRIERNAETDAGELNVCGYYMARDRGYAAVALPVFLHRRFRHGFLFVNPAKGYAHPAAIKGGKIACLGGINAAANVWLRGILSDEYGLRLEDATWYTDGPPEFYLPKGATIDPKPGFEVHVVREPGRLEEQLLAGEIDLLMAPSYPKAFAAGDPRIARLFPDYAAVEAVYYRKTSLFPIMHTLVIKAALLATYPWLAPNIAYAFNESKRLALHHLTNPRALPIAFYTSVMEEQAALLGPDPWQYGLNPINRANVETSLRYTYEQGFIASMPLVDELFHPIDALAWRGIQSF